MTKQEKYSDEDLQFFKGLILEKIQKAEEMLGIYKKDTGKNRFSDVKGSEALEKEQEINGKNRDQKEYSETIELIRELKDALIRIERKSYGVCRRTGKLIKKGRLMAYLTTHYSIEAVRAA